MILMMFGAVKSGTFNALSIVSGDETSNLNRASCGRFSFIASSAFFNADSSELLSIFPFSIDCGHLSRFCMNKATPAKVWNLLRCLALRLFSSYFHVVATECSSVVVHSPIFTLSWHDSVPFRGVNRFPAEAARLTFGVVH